MADRANVGVDDAATAPGLRPTRLFGTTTSGSAGFRRVEGPSADQLWHDGPPVARAGCIVGRIGVIRTGIFRLVSAYAR